MNLVMRTLLILQVIFSFAFHPVIAQVLDSIRTGTLTDSRDGHKYNTIKIGDQWWMAENLAYLPVVSPPAIGSVNEPHYYVYDYDGTDSIAAIAYDNYAIYGVLYNWPAVMDGSPYAVDSGCVRGICPEGWHVPDDLEWTALENYLIANGFNCDSTINEDKTAKALASKNFWKISITRCSPGNNPESNNKSSFSALAGGRRDNNGGFSSLTSNGYWWTAREVNSNDAWFRSINYYYDYFSRYHFSKDFGLNVRCIKDQAVIQPGAF